MTKKKISDRKNRKIILAEMNPRKQIPHEGDCTENPLTRKPYIPDPEREYMGYEAKGKLSLGSSFISNYHIAPINSEFIQYQLSLARMDVRDGEMFDEFYKKNVRFIVQLGGKLDAANIPLSIISGPEGLDNALTSLERREADIDSNIKLKQSFEKNRLSIYTKVPYIPYKGGRESALELVDIVLQIVKR